MALKTIYPTQEDIPEQYRDLYAERDGQWELSGIEGVKTQADVDRVQSALTKERSDHKTTKEKLHEFDDVDLEQNQKDQDELVELRVKVEAGAGDKFDEEKFQEAVNKVAETRVKTETTPLKRDLEKVTKERDDFQVANAEHEHKDTVRTVTDAVREAAVTAKITDTAMDDVLMLGERVFEVLEDGSVVTRDGVGVTPGIAADVWLSDMQEKRPHWWPAAQGGGAGGGKNAGFADNPWSNDKWNMTEQGKLYVADSTRAERMAQAAGTTIGGPRPTVVVPPKAA